jgi:hypothetical protein
MTNSSDLLSRRPERLVITGFRNIMAACELGDVNCWEAVWQQYIAELGCGPARRIVGELQYWTRTVRRHAERPLSFYPHCCRLLCHDECMALSLIAAAQADDGETGELAARYLTGQNHPDHLADVWNASLPFAAALGDAGQHVIPVTRDVVESIFIMQQKGACRTSCQRLN